MTRPSDIGRAPMRREASGVISTGTRTITFLANDNSVARDNHVVMTSGLQTENYKKNAVMLWAHDSSQPPIAKCTKLSTSGNALYATMEFVDGSLYPFADTIFQMYKQGIMNAVSISWLPLEWKYSNDPSRPGGIDFLSADLLEISAVPVPALSSALAVARASGINVAPVQVWLNRSGASGINADRAEMITEVARLHRETAESDRAAELVASAPPSTREQRIAEVRALAARIARDDEAAARRPKLR